MKKERKLKIRRNVKNVQEALKRKKKRKFFEKVAAKSAKTVNCSNEKFYSIVSFLSKRTISATKSTKFRETKIFEDFSKETPSFFCVSEKPFSKQKRKNKTKMKEAAVLFCLLFVISLSSAKQICTTSYNDTKCEVSATKPECVEVGKCIEGTGALSSKSTCDDNVYTHLTFDNGKCEGNGTVIANGTIGECVASGQTSQKVTCGAGQLVISAALLSFSIAFAFLKL